MLPKELFSQHQHIGLDLDETLAETFAGMLEAARTLGKLQHCQSIEAFTIHDIFTDPYFDVTREDMHQIWAQYGLTHTQPQDVCVVEGASLGVAYLQKQGITCSIITARNGEDPIKRELTHRWVAYHFPQIPPERIHFTNHYLPSGLSKAEVCKNLGITLLIDDHIDNAYSMLDAGLSMILLEKPWNRDIVFQHPHLYRIAGWQEILDTLS